MNVKTLKYILKRILLAIVTVWVVITVTFFVMHAVPGGPFMGGEGDLRHGPGRPGGQVRPR